MANNGAIETIYKGTLYRSKNEAKWAMFFDLCGIEYQWEPEKFIGWNRLPYIPDFFLPEHNTYVEVKSTFESIHEDYMERKINGVIDYQTTLVSNGLLLLGAFPFDVRIVDGLVLETNWLFWHKGVVSGTARFYAETVPWEDDDRVVLSLEEDYLDAGDPIPSSASPIIKTYSNRSSSRKMFNIVRTVNNHKFEEVANNG